MAVAVDYGHTRETRPPGGSLRSYQGGHQVPVLPDGSRDVTADVAVDALAAATGASAPAVTTVTLTQRVALEALGVGTGRPARAQAEHDPGGYLRALSRAADASDLTTEGGFGGFYWVVASVGGITPPFAVG
jgi:SAM-dependent MidA family methyltransferase